MITVRNETTEDMDGIRAVDAAATATLRQTYRPNEKAMDNKSIISAHLQRLVAVSDGTIIGTVRYHVEEQSLRVIGLGVHPNSRHRGVARELIQFLERIGRTEGVTCLHLYTVKQTGNVDIFKRLGFNVIAERADDFSESDIYSELTDVEMEKPLI